VGSAPPHSSRAHDSTSQVTTSQALEIWSEETVVSGTEVVETGENENAESTAVELNPSITQLEDKTRNSIYADTKPGDPNNVRIATFPRSYTQKECRSPPR